MNSLLQLDITLFLLINHLPHNLILDLFFGFITFIGIAGVIWILITLIIWWKKYKMHDSLLPIVSIVALVSGSLLEAILKDIIRRPRPQLGLNDVFVPFDYVRSFSFPSGHALIAFAFAYILSKFHKQGTLFYYLLAILIAFSRVYLGKHYPFDVFIGALLGILIGIITFRISPYFRRVLNQKFPRVFI
ncbi:MAG: phosphatase PAP2 family protein [Candidatus Gottesmanbacteria bacterium]